MASNDLSNLSIERTDAPRAGRYTGLLLLVLPAVAAVAILTYVFKSGTPAGAEGEPPVRLEPGPATQPAPESASAPDPARLSELRALTDRGALLEARALGFDLLEQPLAPDAAAVVESALGELHIELVFSPAPMPEKAEYTVQPGDTLDRIARTFKTTVALIQRGNQLERSLLHPGDRLRIFTNEFALAISKARNDLLLTANGRFFKRYRVGTGKFSTTPAGTFVISDKIEEPPWWRPDGRMIPFGDPENVLGTRWMALTAADGTDPVRGYGLHGTWEPETIGQQASAGCVRLLNRDVEELFVLVPRGARVTITE